MLVKGIKGYAHPLPEKLVMVRKKLDGTIHILVSRLSL
jgi:hypothetical protein